MNINKNQINDIIIYNKIDTLSKNTLKDINQLFDERLKVYLDMSSYKQDNLNIFDIINNSCVSKFKGQLDNIFDSFFKIKHPSYKGKQLIMDVNKKDYLNEKQLSYDVFHFHFERVKLDIKNNRSGVRT